MIVDKVPRHTKGQNKKAKTGKERNPINTLRFQNLPSDSVDQKHSTKAIIQYKPKIIHETIKILMSANMIRST